MNAGRTTIALVGLLRLMLRLTAAVDEAPAEYFGGRAFDVPLTGALVAGANPGADSVSWRWWLSAGGLALPVAGGEAQVISGGPGGEWFRVVSPEVRRETDALLTWEYPAGTSRRRLMKLHPTNLLESLSAFTAGGPVAVLDSAGRIRPALAREGISTVALAGPERPGLVLVGAAEGADPELRARVKGLAASGVAVVWFRPAPIEPEYFAVAAGGGRVMVSAEPAWNRFAEDPRAVLRFRRVVDLACGRTEFHLPGEAP